MDSIVQPADYTHTQLLCSTIVFHHGKHANSAIPKIEVFANRRHFVEKLIEKQVIEIAPLAFMRGRTLNKAIVILDEAQNTTKSQMKMFLTRMGNEAQLIVNGDITQIDLIRKEDSGLLQATQILKDIDQIGIVHMQNADVVRHPLVQKIIERYAEIEK